MTDETYLPYVRSGQWAISRMVNGEWLSLIQDRSLYRPEDTLIALHACGIPPTVTSLDRYFPIRGEKGRCPTLEFLELFSKLGNGHKKEVGV